MNKPLIFVTVLLAGLAAAATGDVIPRRSEVKVTYIANEGFLLATKESTVLIDALHRGEIEMYAKPAEAILHDLENALGDFSAVDLILVSHYHRDHFKAEAVANHLAANPQAHLLSSPQVIEEVRRAAGRAVDARSAYPPMPGRTKFRTGGVDVEMFRLPHGTGPYAKIQNLGQIFVLGGLRFLHIGDAEVLAENFAAHQLANDKIDYAFIPYWFLTDAEGQRIVRELVRPRNIIAMHIPPADVAAEKEKILAEFPDAIVFRTQQESITLPR